MLKYKSNLIALVGMDTPKSHVGQLRWFYILVLNVNTLYQ